MRFVRLVGISAVSGGLLAGAACGGGGTGSLVAEKKDATITVSPADGTGKARPDARVRVTVADGELTDVKVTGGGEEVGGTFDRGRVAWVAEGGLAPSTGYTVTATAANGDGEKTTVTTAFTTLTPAKPLSVTDVTPGIKGETVGVGMPIIVTLNRAVTDRDAVVHALKVTAEKPVEGAWRWLSPTRLVYRTRTYWPAHQKVRLDAELTGVKAGAGIYGVAGRSWSFDVGAAQITTVDVRRHTMTVRRDGEVVKTTPISAGNGTTREYTTTNGVHLVMGKSNPETMISPGKKPGDPGYYKIIANYAVRFSASGEYVHSAPWSVGSQGRANVSHGCVNASPAAAKWFYDQSQRGDVIKVTGTDRELEPGNGWGYWQIPFSSWAN
ncbi:L,D-transpeptidase [Actinocorallia longicatena]|uniref:Ig-like domain-containing protein n=1 Tax=Actinocorallia longicatena TaxID=111803 RepID=A0ABP6Q6V1_9ACTN